MVSGFVLVRLSGSSISVFPSDFFMVSFCVCVFDFVSPSLEVQFFSFSVHPCTHGFFPTQNTRPVLHHSLADLSHISWSLVYLSVNFSKIKLVQNKDPRYTFISLSLNVLIFYRNTLSLRITLVTYTTRY